MQCSFSSAVSTCGMKFTDTFLMQKPSVKFAWHVLKDINCSSATSVMTILSPLSPNFALSLSLHYFSLFKIVHTAHNFCHRSVNKNLYMTHSLLSKGSSKYLQLRSCFLEFCTKCDTHVLFWTDGYHEQDAWHKCYSSLAVIA